MKIHAKQPLSQRKPRLKRGRNATKERCPCCGEQALFCWRCSCGFAICQSCMTENAWGLTCNYIYWTCPDCGATRSY